ncbi:unnamed protein product [Notodromas monacha]|uniref:Protein XRP2 n=1 Tax=Notodromas monacha TaxID=399045 RepID=A0A7R9BHW8_9CRUS|nr:unnamed protein product [Notodromas monacha]CAG0915529.1 unnamed protein product [Notodromas monacha]
MGAPLKVLVRFSVISVNQRCNLSNTYGLLINVMGCRISRVLSFLTGHSNASALEMSAKKPAKYSWETRPKLDPAEYTFDSVCQDVVGKLPGSIDGQQFIVQNCTDSMILLFDCIGSITIDDCRRCKIFVGPVASSIFIRGCLECTVIVACGQFRMRDCSCLDIMLHCATQPIIESSKNVRFGCYQYFYNGLPEQFSKAGLNFFNNQWWNVHDFTPDDAVSNWDLMPSTEKPDVFLNGREKLGIEYVELEVSSEEETSIIPLSHGDRGMRHDGAGFICLFSYPEHVSDARKVLSAIRDSHKDILLVRSKSMMITESDAERIFNTKIYANVCAGGPVIGLHFCGVDVVITLTRMANRLKRSHVFVAEDNTVAMKRADAFFCFADMMWCVENPSGREITMTPQDLRVQGNMLKFTNVVKGWQYRWFSLDPERGCLEYYIEMPPPDSKVPPRRVMMLGGAVISPTDEDDQTFTVIPVDGDPFKLRTSVKERQNWIQRLRAVAQLHTDAIARNNPPLSVKEQRSSSDTTREYQPTKVKVPIPATGLSAMDALASAQGTLQQTVTVHEALASAIESLPPQSEQWKPTEPQLLIMKATSQAALASLQKCFEMLQTRHYYNSQALQSQAALQGSKKNIFHGPRKPSRKPKTSTSKESTSEQVFATTPK